MKKFKTWLLERFLPAWAKDSVYRENKALRAEIDQRDRRIQELNAYIDGLETSLRSRCRVIIQNGGKP